MEKESYYYARCNYNITARPIKKLSMSELFDLVAGTSTGSLLATALVIPNNNSLSPQKNKFFADKVIEVY
jgi:patatin-like phospholipase/acyl hydrolase